MTLGRTGLALALRLIVLAGAACLASGSQTKAEQTPPGLVFGMPDAKLAPAGTYTIDQDHTAVLARLSHIGYGLSGGEALGRRRARALRLAEGQIRPQLAIVPTALDHLLNDDDAEKRTRVMQEVLKMGKLDIAALERGAA